MNIILASGNPHKLEEFERIFSGHSIRTPKDYGIDFDHEETGNSYLENALGKAQTLCRMLLENKIEGIPVLSDDSGISLPVLGGEPGVFSARYGQKEAGRPLSGNERNLFLLDKMKNIKDRRAFFVCAMVLLYGEYRFFTAQEILPGVLAEEPRGEGGFGYDPLLFLPETGKTVAELGPELKDRLSHRGKAARVLRKILENN
jgi:XTP/dITP diphosphohydrolase